MRFISSKYIVLFAAGVGGSVLDGNCDSELRAAIRASHATLTSGHLPDVGMLEAGLGNCPESYKKAFQIFIETHTSLYRDVGRDALSWLTTVDRNARIHDYVARRGSNIVDTKHLDNSGFWTSASDHFDFRGQVIGRSGGLSAVESADIHVHISALKGAFVDMSRIEDGVSAAVKKDLEKIKAAEQRGGTVVLLSSLQASNLFRQYKGLAEGLIGQAADLCAIATDYNKEAMKAALREWGTNHWLIEQLITVLSHIGPKGSDVELTDFVNEYLDKVVDARHASVYRKYNQLVRSKTENAEQFKIELSVDAGFIHDLIVIGGKFFTTIDSARIELNGDDQFSNAKALALRQRIQEAQAQAHAEFDLSGHWLCPSMRMAIDDAATHFEREIKAHPIHREPTINECDVGVQELVCIQTEGESSDGDGICAVSSSRENLEARSRAAESMFKKYVGMVLKQFERLTNNRHLVRNQTQGLELLRKYLVAVERARVTLSYGFPSSAAHLHQFVHRTIMQKKPMIDRWVMSLPLAIESGLDASEVDVKIEPLVTVKLVNRQHPECQYQPEMVVAQKEAVIAPQQQDQRKEAVAIAINRFFENHRTVYACSIMSTNKSDMVDCFGENLVSSMKALNQALARGGGDAAIERFLEYQGRSIDRTNSVVGRSFTVNIDRLDELNHINIESVLEALVARRHSMEWTQSTPNIISITFHPKDESSSKNGVMGFIKSILTL